MATNDTTGGALEGSVAQMERFPWADEVEVSEEMEGWEEMYPDYFIFDRTEERSTYEHDQFWFWDKSHCNEPIVPWDIIHICSSARNSQTVRPWTLVLGHDRGIGVTIYWEKPTQNTP